MKLQFTTIMLSSSQRLNRIQKRIHTATARITVMGILTKRIKGIAMLGMCIHMHLIGTLLIRMDREL